MPRIFGVGCAKSGTHRLAAMLGEGAVHEADTGALLNLLLARAAGRLGTAQFDQLVVQLLARRRAECDVSQINGTIVDTLVRSCPTARYILTLRAARPWLRSYINHQLTVPLPPGSLWIAYRTLRFGVPPYHFAREEAALAAAGLYPVEAYLDYWVRHQRDVLAAVPPARLLIVATSSLDAAADDIARFADTVPAAAGRSFEGRYVDNPLDRVDPAWLTAQITAHTARLIALAGDRFDAAIVTSLGSD